MNPPPNPEYEQAIRDFERGGWITSMFGGAGMLARMLITDESSPWIWWVRRIVASVIVGVLSYFALWNVEMSGMYKSIILATSGMACPEIIEGIRAQYKKRLGNEKQKTKKRRGK